MRSKLKRYLSSMVIVLLVQSVSGADYYVNSRLGDDVNSGTSKATPFRSLQRINTLELKAGDRVLLASDGVFRGTLILDKLSGTKRRPIVVTSYNVSENKPTQKAVTDANGYLNGVLINDCSHIVVENIEITADGGNTSPLNTEQEMRCGVLVNVSEKGDYQNITLKNLHIHEIFYEDQDFQRGKDEVRTANGVQNYGWGIRFLNNNKASFLSDLRVQNCEIDNVAHTGIKFSGVNENIKNVQVLNNKVTHTGGPGIQLSGVHKGLFKGNEVDFSGSNDDSRKWGRGSGLWTWGSSDIIIEHNEFKNAKGPGDSAGCHIDFNCRNVIVQYNFSYYNAGGFIEILGNNYNCAYRYNVSVNDGYRVKGEDGAFQEGKILWLSGYQGNRAHRGPFNSYIYNNTVYVESAIVAKVAVTKAAKGVLVANNIFCVTGDSQAVLGDQYKPEGIGLGTIEDVCFTNNLYLKKGNWPELVLIQDSKPVFGDPDFAIDNGINLSDYIPNNVAFIENKGIHIPTLPNDSLGVFIGLKVKRDILGKKIKGKPDMGAFEIY